MTRQEIIDEFTRTISIAEFQSERHGTYQCLIPNFSWERIVHLAQLLSENNFCKGCLYSGKCTVDRICETQVKGG